MRCRSRQPGQDVKAVIIGEGGGVDEGGKEFIVDGPNEGCDLGGVEVIQILEFVEIDLVFTLTTEHGIDRGITVLGGREKRGRRLAWDLGDST